MFKLIIPSEGSKKITLKLQAKIVKRVTKIKPEYIIKEGKLPKYKSTDQ